MHRLPETGFLRLRDILPDRKNGRPGLIPVSRSTWWAGVKSGKFPSGVLLGPNTRAWRVEDIKALIANMSVQP